MDAGVDARGQETSTDIMNSLLGDTVLPGRVLFYYYLLSRTN